jgi:hypothetical protein
VLSASQVSEANGWLNFDCKQRNTFQYLGIEALSRMQLKLDFNCLEWKNAFPSIKKPMIAFAFMPVF